MFGRKKDKLVKPMDEEMKKPAQITKMPDVFYGGADPEIYHAPKSAKVDTEKMLEVPKKVKHTQLPSAPSQPSLLANKKLVYIAGGIIFVIIVALISWYYIDQARVDVPTADPVPMMEEDDSMTESEAENEPEPEPEVEVEPVATSTPALDDPAGLDFPRIVIVDDIDLDADSLTDVEEELFDTDSGTWDSDGDGYYDGQEIVNLYSPKATAPAKLIDAGLIQEYVNPVWQYRLYYPLGWQAAAVDPNSDQVLFSGITGDYVEVIAVDKEPGSAFADWFSKNANGQRFGDVVSFANRFQVDGSKRQDSLVAYFEKDQVVFVMIYHPGTSGFISFRHVMIMMMQSFRTSKTSLNIPEQVIIPTEGTAPADGFGDLDADKANTGITTSTP